MQPASCRWQSKEHHRCAPLLTALPPLFSMHLVSPSVAPSINEGSRRSPIFFSSFLEAGNSCRCRRLLFHLQSSCSFSAPVVPLPPLPPLSHVRFHLSAVASGALSLPVPLPASTPLYVCSTLRTPASLFFLSCPWAADISCGHLASTPGTAALCHWLELMDQNITSWILFLDRGSWLIKVCIR